MSDRRQLTVIAMAGSDRMDSWLSRIDMRFLSSKYLGLLTASPGKGGGVRAEAQMRQHLENMRITVHSPSFSLPAAAQALIDHELDGLSSWVEDFLDAAGEAASRIETS